MDTMRVKRPSEPTFGCWSLQQLSLICLVMFARVATALDIRTCNLALGMESGSISDLAVNASSSYVTNVGPRYGRLRKEVAGGAWCPKRQIESGVREWLQIDLGEAHVVTAIETQGRFDHGRGQEYTEEYTIEYWRPDLNGWRRYRLWNGDEVLAGNVDTSTVVSRQLIPAIFATQLRVLPHSVHRRTVCLRVELKGCQDLGGVVSYSIPESPVMELSDTSYDGVRREGRLSGGLGRLVDGETGADNYRQDIAYERGTGWLAWMRDNYPDNFIELIFYFDNVRTFNAVHIYTNNYFKRDVQVFARAEVRFGGSDGSPEIDEDAEKPISYSYIPDTNLENARNVSIALHERQGSFLKFRLYFAGRWIMISEVTFDSWNPYANATEETATERSNEDGVSTVNHDADLNLQTITAREEDQEYVEVLIGVLTAITLLLLLVFIIILLLSRRQKLQSSPTVLKNPFGFAINMKGFLLNLAPDRMLSETGRDSPDADDEEADAMEDDELPEDEKEEEQEEDEDEVRKLRRVEQQQQHKQQHQQHQQEEEEEEPDDDVDDDDDSRELVKPKEDEYPETDVNPLRGPVLENLGIQSSLTMDPFNSTLVESPYKSTYAMLSGMESPKQELRPSKSLERGYEPRQDSGGSSSPSGRQAQYYRSLQAGGQVPSSCRLALPGPASQQRDNKRWHTAPKEKHKVPVPVVRWNIAPSMSKPYKCKEIEPASIPSQCLHTMEKLGSGHIGEAIVCAVLGLPESVTPSSKLGGSSTEPLRLVVARIPSSGYPEELPETTNLGNGGRDALREVRFLSSLADPNIARVLGLVRDVEPSRPWTIIEYTELGDLAHYLQYSEPLVGTQRPSCTLNFISQNCLLYMGKQIASAMRYLESKNLVHKDLAARNCLLGRCYTVKVTDIAMCSDLYKKDYSDIGGRPPAPIRWLPWESILLDRYACSSTVWSFAVTLWEIMSFAREKPFQHLTNEQVIQNAELMYYGNELQVLLPKPMMCPENVYKVMCSCWKRDESARPTFKEIHGFLKEITADYRP